MKAGVDAAFLDQVLAHLPTAPQDYDALARSLRTAFPDRHISVCGENDISPRLKPVAENARAEIYLVASSEHCLSLTNDAAVATGIVVALRDGDD